MAFKDILIKVRRAFSCCGNRDRKLLSIGSPTDVRRVDISESLPGLSDIDRKYVREKLGASSDGIHLLGLQSHPPSMPPTTAPTPVRDRSPSLEPSSVVSSREPSEALLNAASKDLPNSLPTPPKRHHKENSPPSARMKSMWDNARRTSAGSGHHDQLYEKLEQVQGSQQNKSTNNSFTMLSLNFEDDKKGSDTPRTLSLTDITEGFEMQNITGGHSQMTTPTQKIQVAKRTTGTTINESGSDSEEDLRPKHENVTFVKI